MYYGKKVCETLKQIRKKIADENEIPYEITECNHEGDCQGTCPKCESEMRYIEKKLEERNKKGIAASIVGIAVGIGSLFPSCSLLDKYRVPGPNAGSVPNTSIDGGEDDNIPGEVIEVELEGDVVAVPDSLETDSIDIDNNIVDVNQE